MSDAALIASLRAGDEAAFGELVDRERASLKTRIFRILANIAKTRGMREGPTIPFSSVAGEEEEYGHSVDPDRFIPADAERAPRHWAIPPP